MGSTASRVDDESFHSPECAIKNEIVTIDGSVPMWISRVQPQNQNPSLADVVVLVLPGLPGLTGLYHDFIEGLYESSHRSVEIIGLSYPGHYDLDSLRLPLEGHKRDYPSSRYSLRDQCKIVLSFITNKISKNKKLILILICHSLGCYFALELLRNFEEHHRIMKMILIHPAIEKMMASPLLKAMLPYSFFTKNFQFILGIIADCIPRIIKEKIIAGLCYIQGYTNKGGLTESLCALFTYEGLSNFSHISPYISAINELEHGELIEQHQNKIIFYYASWDVIVPISCYYRMKTRFPNADIKLCQHEHKHHFNILTSYQMSELVWKWCVEGMDKAKEKRGEIEN